jgi:hypothetical protein
VSGTTDELHDLVHALTDIFATTTTTYLGEQTTGGVSIAAIAYQNPECKYQRPKGSSYVPGIDELL